ncbi:MAG: GNAT family N-acetyltransferase [Sporichthyaceae bacterium]
MSAHLSIREATAADLDAMLALVHSAYRGEPSRAGWTSEADLLEGPRTDVDFLTADLADPATTILLAHDDGVLLACCEVTISGAGRAHFGMFAVHPPAQGCGVGSRLLIAAQDYARALGCTRMEMAVLAQRAELLAWYGRRGYLPTGAAEPFPYGNPRYGTPRRPDLVFTVLAKELRVGPGDVAADVE